MNRGPGGVRPVASTGPPPPPQAEADGSRIGRYELLRKLGAGGMAEVHLARATGLEGFEKLLVLKRILPHLVADAHFVQMFLAEARLAALLQHPNIVQVYDLGKDASEFYFTMEFVYGENAYAISRAARKRGEQLPIEHAISIIVGAAAGLHYAHERVGMDGQPLGIVHRDVSPTNLMVTYDGCAKVADFGIAKVTNRTEVTQAGIRKGKVPYMSPEQCKAARVDRRSDVFALGICLYELSTGVRLFEGDNEFGVMNRIVTGDIPLPSTQRAGYPKALERIVMRALSVDLEKRYPTCRHMQHELEAFVRDNKLDASMSALGRWMHRVFKPQPFPWGALQGDGVSGGQGARPTLAGSGAGLGSRPGDSVSRPDVTPLSDGAPMPSSAASAGRVGSVSSHVGRPQRRLSTNAGPSDGGTLKGIAMGLGIVAAIAVLSVGGLIVYKQTHDEPAGTADSASEPAKTTPQEPIDGSPPGGKDTQPAAVVGVPAPAEPVAPPDAANDPVDAPQIEDAQEPAPAAAPAAAPQDPVADPPPSEPEPEPVDTVQIEDVAEQPPAQRRPNRKPKRSKKKPKKKADRDAFLPL